MNTTTPTERQPALLLATTFAPLFAPLLALLLAAIPALIPAQTRPAAAAAGAQGPQYLTLADLPSMEGMVGQSVLFHGRAASLRPSWNERAPNILTVSDGTREIDIAFWSYRDTSAAQHAATLFGTPGTPVYVRGNIERFQDKLQINAGSNAMQINNRPLPGTTPPTGAPAGPPAAAPGGPPAARPAAPQAAQQAAPQAAFATPPPPPPGERITLRPYGPLGAQQAVETTGSALIYVRSPSSALSRSFEESYLLHADALELIGPRTVFHIDIDQDEGRRQATQLQVDHAPTMILLQRDKDRVVFPFRDDTTPDAALRFFRQIPR